MLLYSYFYGSIMTVFLQVCISSEIYDVFTFFLFLQMLSKFRLPLSFFTLDISTFLRKHGFNLKCISWTLMYINLTKVRLRSIDFFLKEPRRINSESPLLNSLSLMETCNFLQNMIHWFFFYENVNHYFYFCFYGRISCR